MSFQKHLLNIFFIFSTLLISYISSAENLEFLDTPDELNYFKLKGHGLEAGFFVLIKFIANETLLPKSSLIPNLEAKQPTTQEINQEYVFKKLLLLEPIIIFSNNSAECNIFQGPYYHLNEIVDEGTEVSFSYLIGTNAKNPGLSCNLEIFVLGENQPRKTIDYSTYSGE